MNKLNEFGRANEISRMMAGGGVSNMLTFVMVFYTGHFEFYCNGKPTRTGIWYNPLCDAFIAKDGFAFADICLNKINGFWKRSSLWFKNFQFDK